MKVSIIPLIVRKLRKALAIVQDTNTATRNIDAGKFVMWKGELCKALSAITTGDTLSSTNLEACTDGGLNELNSKTYTVLGTITGSEEIIIPSGTKELIFVLRQSSSYGYRHEDTQFMSYADFYEHAYSASYSESASISGLWADGQLRWIVWKNTSTTIKAKCVVAGGWGNGVRVYSK